ncbi:MAG TPA: carboxypeptidase-like regulatory domain-containing protein [Bryobacteraceae bacterium]|nr:carboxypeptidase-like regulatory domain-containing protein [Bryobacteraceae bacterium]
MKTCFRTLPALLFAAVSIASAWAQSSSSLTGLVTDPSGAVIPGAEIVAINLGTNAQRKATSDSEGRYTFPQMQPGNYEVTANATGFSEILVHSVPLLVNTPATLDIKFQVGTVQQKVAVTAETTQVNTQDATLGNAIGTHAITELPFDARNVVGLLSIQPGVTYFGDPSERDDYRSGAVNGGKSDQGNVTLDGVDVNDQQYRTAFTSVLRATLDSVQEFRTTTTNGTADAGHSSGAQVAMVTKSGTNALHGSLYEYTRNTLTSANTFFNNEDGIPRQTLIRNVYGASLGGPIKKNRIFYFLNYEGRRDASQASAVRVVPNMLFRQGTFTYKTTGGSLEQLDPAQVQALDPQNIGESAAVLKVLQSYPAPNDTTVGDGLNTSGYRFNSSVPLSYNTYISRIDYQLDNNGKHTLFWRGQMQNDHYVPSSTSDNGLPEFPGQADSTIHLENDKGIAVGYSWIVSPTLVNSLRYGFTRQSYDDTGVQTTPIVTFDAIASPFATTKPLTAIVPNHDIEENLTWTHGPHTFLFGGSLHFTRTHRLSFANSYSGAETTPGWFLDNARYLLEPNVNPSTLSSYTDQMVNLLGLVSQGTADYNYDKNGDLLPQGEGISRDFADNEYEFYLQDTWKVSRSFTVTAGAHINISPPLYEVNGYQTSTNIPLGQWFNDRGGLAEAGLPQSDVTPISFQLADSPGGRPLYPTQRHIAPRIGFAYSPQGDSGWAKRLFGGAGKTSIRAGFGIYYDTFGQSLIRLADATSLGFSTTLQNPGTQTYQTVQRYISPTQIPAGLLPGAPAGGFPQVAPDDYAVTSGLDSDLTNPYSMNMDFSIGRDLDHGFHIETSYIGRLSRHSLIGDDVGMYTNMVDPQSGQTYFQAATAMQQYVRQNAPLSSVKPIPFFQDLFPGYAGSGLSATQNIYQNYWTQNPASDTTALQVIDASASNCSPCSIYGPNAMYNAQYVALTAFRSIGSGDYHAFETSIRKRFSEGLQFDFNYTLSKCMDMGSTRESDGSTADLIQNPWNPGQMRAVCDYDVRNMVSAFMVAELPFGRGRLLASHANKFVNGLIGGWQLSGIWRQSSGLPVGVDNGGYWPTNWNQSGFATQLGPFQEGTTKNSPSGGPNLFPDPAAAFDAFGLTYAGQSGSRNVVRGDGFFTIDAGLSKRFIMPYNEHHSFQIRAEAFNLTNTVRFDVNQMSLSMSNEVSFGKYNGTLNSPRVFQFAGRYEF